MNLKIKIVPALCLFLSTGITYAEIPILDKVNVSSPYKAMSSKDMEKSRGAALIINQPHPSTTEGIVTHQVTYLGWGNTSDYNSYNYIGNFFNNGDYISYSYNGGTYYTMGDLWEADMLSDPNSWNASNAQLIEYHLQVMDPATFQPTEFAFRESDWNRPITTFSW